MLQHDQQHNYQQKNTPIEDSNVDIKQIIAKSLTNWHLFVLSIIVFLGMSVIYGYYASPNWNIFGKILVKDSKNSPQSALGGSLNADIGSLFNAKSSADNEIQILKSRSLMINTINEMMLNVRTYRINGTRSREIFDEAPFEIKIDYKADTLKERFYHIEILDKNTFKITNSKEDVDYVTKFGDVIKLKQYNLTLKKKSSGRFSGNYKLFIESKDATVDAFTKNFSANLSEKQATSIDLTLSYPNPKKGEAILNKLMQLYLLSNLQNEVQIADSTMKFINGRIEVVGRELGEVEKKLERYKEENNLVNVAEQSKVLVTSASNFNEKLIQQQVQLSVIDDLQRFLANPGNRKAIPTSLVINTADQSFGQAINSYNELLMSRDRASLSYTESNPIIQNFDKQISNARNSLLKNLESYKKGLSVGQKELKRESNNYAGQLRSIPGKERNYLDFARQQNLKQELYLFLLQKREETAISKTSTISSSRIIDPAKSEFLPYAPKKIVYYLIGLVIGIILPATYLFFREFLNIRLNSKSDIESATHAPILGEIGHNSDKQSLVTGRNSRSVISEQFRTLRTNLQFLIDGSQSNVLLFTSSMSGEGKSFLSLNLGSVLALADKKVVFIELDLRKPKLSESVGLTNDNGYTNYAIDADKNYDFKKLLKPLEANPNCYLISSGPVPPNPAELLMSEKLSTLIKYLKTEFDYIIIDCAPVGLVTDALIIEKYANLTFYVTRQGYTFKSQLNIVNDLLNQKKVKNMYLLVNDIKEVKSGYSSYGNSYGYGYGYGIEESSKKSMFRFWK